MFAQKDFLYCLGVATLFVFAIYFAYAVLKGSGEGIQKILGPGNVLEGMTNRQKENHYNNFVENIDKTIENKKKKLETLNNNIKDISDYKEKFRELADLDQEIFMKSFIGGCCGSKDFNSKDILDNLNMAAKNAPLGALSYFSDKTESILD